MSFTYSLFSSTTSAKSCSENLANSTASRPRASISLALLLVDAAADAAGQAPVGMDGPAAHELDQGVAVAAHLEHLAGDVHADLLDHAEDVALGGRGGGADDEIRPAQGVKMRGVVGRVEDAVEQLAEFFGRRRRIDVEHGVQGLGGRHVVGLGADAADAGGQVGHVLGRPPHAELLEAAQLGNLQIGSWPRRPASSRKMSILPWPSRRVIGSMEMRFMAAGLRCCRCCRAGPAFRCRRAVAVGFFARRNWLPARLKR